MTDSAARPLRDSEIPCANHPDIIGPCMCPPASAATEGPGVTWCPRCLGTANYLPGEPMCSTCLTEVIFDAAN